MRSIRALAWCAKHIWAWQGSDHIWEKEPAAAPGENASHDERRSCTRKQQQPLWTILYLQSLLSNERQKCFYFCSNVFDDDLIRLPHQSTPCIVKLHMQCICLDWNCKAREDFEICIFMHFKVCDIYSSHGSCSKFVQRSEAKFTHWPLRRAAKCQREEQHGSHTSLMLKETKDEMFLILDATLETGRVGSVLHAG